MILSGRELKAVDDLSANTPGLRLESAEVGYQRLRFIGFEAERARRLLPGLGKEKGSELKVMLTEKNKFFVFPDYDETKNT